MIRRTRRATLGAIPLALMAGLGACGDDGTTAPEPVDSILRFAISLNGFVVLESGDTIFIAGATGELNVAQPFDPNSANGANEVDVGIFTDAAPAQGVTGIHFTTNTILTGPNTVAASGMDVADVVTFGNEADVEATLLTAVVGTDCTTPPPDNVFSADTLVYKMVTGRVLITLPPGGASGSVAFGGNPCDGSSSASTQLSATFSGSRLQ